MGRLVPWRSRRLKSLDEFEPDGQWWLQDRRRTADRAPNGGNIAIIVLGLTIGGVIGSVLAFGDPAALLAGTRDRGGHSRRRRRH